MGGVVAFLIFKLVHSSILTAPDPERAAQQHVPKFSAMTCGILAVFLCVSGPAQFRVTTTAAIGIGLIVCGASFMYFATRGTDYSSIPAVDDDIDVEDRLSAQSRLHSAERSFTGLMVMTACVVALAHGSNDVSNSIGPFNAIIGIYTTGDLDLSASVPLWVLVCGGLGIGK